MLFAPISLMLQLLSEELEGCGTLCEHPPSTGTFFSSFTLLLRKHLIRGSLSLLFFCDGSCGFFSHTTGIIAIYSTWHEFPSGLHVDNGIARRKCSKRALKNSVRAAQREKKPQNNHIRITHLCQLFCLVSICARSLLN